MVKRWELLILKVYPRKTPLVERMWKDVAGGAEERFHADPLVLA
jgi:hypothetical protein